MIVSNIHAIPNLGFTMSLLFLPAVCKDRLDAMKKPMEYNTRNNKKRSIVIFCVCAVVALSVTIPNFFRFTVLSKDGQYLVVQNLEYLNSITGLLLCVSVPLLRTTCSITASFGSVRVARHYRQFYQNQKADVRAGVVNERERKMVHERTLALLLLAEVLLSLIGFLPINVKFITHFLPNNTPGGKSKLLAFAEVFAMAAVSWNIFIYIYMSRSFRKEFFFVLKRFFCLICDRTGNTVHVL